MAQVSNVTLTIGTTNVGPKRRLQVLIPPPPADTRQYRLVTVGANLNFTSQEIGLKYKLYAALYSTDNLSDDTDSFESSSPFLFREDAGVTELANLGNDKKSFVFIPKDYQEITVNATIMPINFSRHLLLDTLNEDTDIKRLVFPRFETIYLKDELFARVWLTSVGQSAITQTVIR